MAWHQGYLCILEGFEMQRKIYFVLMLLWMGVIFGFSAQPAAESTQTSLRVGSQVCGIFVKDYEEMSAAEQTALAENIEFPKGSACVRVCAAWYIGLWCSAKKRNDEETDALRYFGNCFLCGK